MVIIVYFYIGTTRVDMFDRYYRILGLEPGADEEAIRRAYRNLAKIHHPDVNKSPDAHAGFVRIAEAYEILIKNKKLLGEGREMLSEEDLRERYRKFFEEARERAKEASRMRYERLKKEHEAFQQSGAYDLLLLGRLVFNIILLVAAIGAIIFPVVMAFHYGLAQFFGLIYFWIVGGFLLAYIYSQRKTFFKPGKFFYNRDRLKEWIRERKGKGTETCRYSVPEKANALPFRISMLLVKDVKLKNEGFLRHHVGYDRKYVNLSIPRSQKAFRSHQLVSLLKFLILVGAFFIIRTESWFWRFLMGMVTAWSVSVLLLRFLAVKSKSSYLATGNNLLKIALWVVPLILLTRVDPLGNLYTHEAFGAVILMNLIFLDIILDPLYRLLKIDRKMYRPLGKQPARIEKHLDQGYQFFLDIPVWSTIFPLVRWFV